MTAAEWQAAFNAKNEAWIASGQNTLDSLCALVTFPEGVKEFMSQCFFPGGNSGGSGGSPEGITDVVSCEDLWKVMCATMKPGDPGYDKCPGATPAETPEVPPPEAPAAQIPSEEPVPLSIDIQAFTPGGTGPIQAQPLFQPQGPPPIKQELPAPPKAQWVAPKPVEKSLDTGSAIGIGAFLVAIGAAALFSGK